MGLGGIAQKRGYRCWRQRLTGRYKVHGRLRAPKPCQFVTAGAFLMLIRYPALPPVAMRFCAFQHRQPLWRGQYVTQCGVHVCVDKPLAENLRDAERLVELAARKN